MSIVDSSVVDFSVLVRTWVSGLDDALLEVALC